MKLNITLVAMLSLFLNFGMAQIDSTQTTDAATGNPIAVKEDQTTLWRSGKTKYPAKPKNMWELGLHAGNYFIDGDVDPKLPGFGLGLHLRKAIHYAFSVRADLFYGQAYGLDPQYSGENLEPEPEVFAGYDRNNPWFPSYKTQYYYAVAEGILNIGNILFHKDHNKWNFYLFVGAGFDHNKTLLDLRDAQGNVYTNLIQKTGFDFDKFNTRQGRKDIKANLKNIYDGTYDTEAYKKKGIFRINDNFNIHTVFIGGVGVSRKINNRINLSIEHQVHVTDNDKLDGILWRTATDQSRQDDIQHYTDLRLAFNIGRKSKKVEPLYWVNPLDAAYSDLAELKQRPKFDLTDTDQDGVIDMLDQEPETPAGAPVDTRGITLDSDNDGAPDYKDQEPYSPPGFPVNDKGIAQVPVTPKITPDDVNNMIDKKMGEAGIVANNPTSGNTMGGNNNVGNKSGGNTTGGNVGGGNGNSRNCCSPDWFLPMIHFNLDEYCVKDQYVTQLHNVAQVMLTHPDMMITAYGHTDIQNSNSYNQVLSYNRAKAAIDYLVSKYKLPRERFKLMYGGEESPLGQSHYINRRVEFRVSQPDDQDMARPAGPEAGDCHKKRSRKAAVKTDNGTSDDKKNGY